MIQVGGKGAHQWISTIDSKGWWKSEGEEPRWVNKERGREGNKKTQGPYKSEDHNTMPKDHHTILETMHAFNAGNKDTLPKTALRGSSAATTMRTLLTSMTTIKNIMITMPYSSQSIWQMTSKHDWPISQETTRLNQRRKWVQMRIFQLLDQVSTNQAKQQ